MKTKTLLFTIIFVLPLWIKCQDQNDVLKLKGVLIENDYHEKITWIKSKPTALVEKDFTVNAKDVSHIQIYFGLYLKDSIQKHTPIRIINTYTNSEWIFFDEISYLIGNRKEIRAGNGKVFKLYDSKTNRKVKNGVTEKSDVEATTEILNFISYIANNSVTKMECKYINNQSSQAYSLQVSDGTKKLQKHFMAFIEAYNQVTKKYSLENQFIK